MSSSRTGLSPKTVARETKNPDWILDKTCTNITSSMRGSDLLRWNLFLSFQQALRGPVPEVIYEERRACAVLPNGATTSSLTAGETFEVQCYSPHDMSAHRTLLKTEVGIRHLGSRKRQATTFWSVLCIFSHHRHFRQIKTLG